MKVSSNDVSNNAMLLRDDINWEVYIKCDDDKGNFYERTTLYKNYDFNGKGLPLSLLLNTFVGSYPPLEYMPILWPILPECYNLSGVIEVQVKKGSVSLDLNKVDQEYARKCVEVYITNNHPNLSLQEIKKMLDDSFQKELPNTY